MKSIYLLLIALFLVQIKCDEIYCGDEDDPKSANDCKNNNKFDPGDDDDFKYCCFLEGKRKGQDLKTCWPLMEESYKKINDYIDEMEKNGFSGVSIKCSSYYIKISLLSLILLLF